MVWECEGQGGHYGPFLSFSTYVLLPYPVFNMWIFLSITVLTTLLSCCMSAHLNANRLVYLFQWHLFPKAVVAFELSVVQWHEESGVVWSVWEQILGLLQDRSPKDQWRLWLSPVVIGLWLKHLYLVHCKFILSVNLGRKCFLLSECYETVHLHIFMFCK